MKPLQSQDDVAELLRATKALAVLAAWSELGLFDALAEGPRPLSALPGDRRAVAITAAVVRHLGLLVGDDEQVGLSPAAKRLLADGHMPGGRNLEFLRDYGRMLDVLRDGGPVRGDDGEAKVTEGGVRRDSVERTARFLEMLFQQSSESAHQLFEWLGPQLPAGGGVLDLGGGHGRYARTFADAGFSATLFDLPHVIELARRRHGEAIAYLEGDFHKVDDFGGPYDLILLSNIVHGESHANNARLIAKLARTLRKGGQLVLKDMFLDEHGSHPANAALFGLTMLYYTRSGSSPRASEARQWLADAGLEGIQLLDFGVYQLVRGLHP